MQYATLYKLDCHACFVALYGTRKTIKKYQLLELTRCTLVARAVYYDQRCVFFSAILETHTTKRTQEFMPLYGFSGTF